MNQKTILALGAALGALAVILGASGAHAWKPLLESMNRVSTFELANRYHFYHAIVMVLCGVLASENQKILSWAAALLFFGVLFFSGSLYVMSFFQLPKLGPITPLGGVCLIAGWTLMVIAVVTKKPSKKLDGY